MKICVVPSDWDGAAHYRCFYPSAHLSELGHTCIVPPVKQHGDTFVFENIDQTLPAIGADVYLLHHPVSRDFPKMKQILPGKLVVDLDDDFRNLPAYHPASWMRTTKPENQPRHMRWLEQTLATADGVTVATEALASSYAEFSPIVLRNRLHWPLWRDVTPVYEQTWRRVRVGWMGGIEWRSADLEVLRGVIGPWLQEHPDVEFVAAGDQRVHNYLGIPDGQRVTTARVPFRNKDLPYTTATMDIGLVPLARNAFNDAKSHLKGMEYNACGIPFVATPTHEYRLWADEGVNGFLAEKPKQWRDRLDELVADAALRRRMGELARAKAEANSLSAHIHEWEAAYRDICGGDYPDDPESGRASGGLRLVGGDADGSGDASREGGRERLWTPAAA